MILKTIKSDALNIHISAISKGFSVAYQDIDSGEFLPTVYIFPTLQAAEVKASKALAS